MSSLAIISIQGSKRTENENGGLYGNKSLYMILWKIDYSNHIYNLPLADPSIHLNGFPPVWY